MTTPTSTHPSILASLRALTPRCHVEFDDAKRLAEHQAARLLDRLDAAGEGILEAHLAALPRLTIVREPLPTSGLSYWNGQTWIVVLNCDDSDARQRFTLLHEFKHIIDHGQSTRLYANETQAERAADYFAACALMPRPQVKRVFCNVTQRIDQLATYFGVSQSAIRIRIQQIGLIDAPTFTRERCARPVSTPHSQEQRFRTTTPRRSYA